MRYYIARCCRLYYIYARPRIVYSLGCAKDYVVCNVENMIERPRKFVVVFNNKTYDTIMYNDEVCTGGAAAMLPIRIMSRDTFFSFFFCTIFVANDVYYKNGAYCGCNRSEEYGLSDRQWVV